MHTELAKVSTQVPTLDLELDEPGAPWFLALVLQQHLPRHGWQVQLLLRAMLV